MRIRKTLLLFAALVAFGTPALAQDDPFGGPGGHYLVAQELPGSTITPANRCASHFGPLDMVVEAVREAELVAPVADQATGTMDFAAAAGGEVIGTVSACYVASEGRDRAMLLVLELVSGEDRLLVEAAGECKDSPIPLESSTLFQSCSLHITGPKTEGVRSGTVTSGGLVPKAKPTESVTPNTWTIFVVRD